MIIIVIMVMMVMMIICLEDEKTSWESYLSNGKILLLTQVQISKKFLRKIVNISYP